MRFPLLLVKLSILASIFRVVAVAQEPELVRHFDYDQSAPFELKTLGTQNRGGGVMPAYLVVLSTASPISTNRHD